MLMYCFQDEAYCCGVGGRVFVSGLAGKQRRVLRVERFALIYISFNVAAARLVQRQFISINLWHSASSVLLHCVRVECPLGFDMTLILFYRIVATHSTALY
jgi:hypothetical protein